MVESSNSDPSDFCPPTLSATLIPEAEVSRATNLTRKGTAAEASSAAAKNASAHRVNAEPRWEPRGIWGDAHHDAHYDTRALRQP
jgi:hypothetical protein